MESRGKKGQIGNERRGEPADYNPRISLFKDIKTILYYKEAISGVIGILIDEICLQADRSRKWNLPVAGISKTIDSLAKLIEFNQGLDVVLSKKKAAEDYDRTILEEEFIKEDPEARRLLRELFLRQSNYIKAKKINYSHERMRGEI